MNRRQGFSLLEVLMVVTILGALLAMSIGAFAGVRERKGLVGLESLMSDLLRQARVTARSSAAPVVLQIDAERNEIRGITRLPLFMQSFDDLADARVGAFGRTGGGFKVNQRTPAEALVVPFTDPESGAAMRLIRRNRGDDGLLLSCAVRPPLVTKANDSLPLVAVLPIGSLGYDRSSFGIALAPISAHRQGSGAGTTVVVHSWQVVGWARAGNTVNVIKVNEAELKANLSADAQEHDLPRVLGNQRWYDVSLAHDGRYLHLYLNGREITAPVECGPMDDGDERIPLQLAIGGLDFGTNNVVSRDCLIDDVGIWRLGTDRPISLPSGFHPQSSSRVVIHPDGRTDISDPLVFRMGDELTSATAAIDVMGDGSIVSRVFSGVKP